MNSILQNRKIRVENQTKTRVLCPETSAQNAVQEFHLSVTHISSGTRSPFPFVFYFTEIWHKWSLPWILLIPDLNTFLQTIALYLRAQICLCRKYLLFLYVSVKWTHFLFIFNCSQGRFTTSCMFSDHTKLHMVQILYSIHSEIYVRVVCMYVLLD